MDRTLVVLLVGAKNHRAQMEGGNHTPQRCTAVYVKKVLQAQDRKNAGSPQPINHSRRDAIPVAEMSQQSVESTSGPVTCQDGDQCRDKRKIPRDTCR